MIMQRLDNNGDDELSVSDMPPGSSTSVFPDAPLVPGLMYRGVPQDQRRRSLRIDAVSRHTSLCSGPTWIVARRLHRECNLAELFFG